MSRVQLALNVGNLNDAIVFYTKMFGVGPAKVREGYAEDTDQVAAKIESATAMGMPIEIQESETCCFAVQDKVWIKGGELPWEWYTVLADAPADSSLKVMPIMLGVPSTGSCCGPEGC